MAPGTGVSNISPSAAIGGASKDQFTILQERERGLAFDDVHETDLNAVQVLRDVNEP